MKLDTAKIAEMYDFLSASTNPLSKSDGAFVFCRADPLVAARAAEIYREGLVDYIMFTGGIGKDSGYLIDLQVPEAKFQAALAVNLYGIPKEAIYVESTAKNGGECCRLGIETVRNSSRPCESMILLVHPTSLRRTEELIKFEGSRKGFTPSYQRTGTRYNFDPTNVVDQKEAVAELLRLKQWPEKGWLFPQNNLPEDLVSYALELDAKWKNEKL